MSSIEITEGENGRTSVIEVQSLGAPPQGNLRIAKLLVSFSTVTIAVPEDQVGVVVDLGTASDAWMELSDGAVKVLSNFTEMHGTIELQVVKSGGGVAGLNFWAEYRYPLQPWTIAPESLRSVEVAKDGEGVYTFDVSGLGNYTPGIEFRFRLNNTGGGSLVLSSPTISTSNGVVSGKSAKATILHT